MSDTTTISASDVLCNLKAVVADLECQQKQQLFKQLQQQLQHEQQLQKRYQQEQEQKRRSPVQQPMFLMIPVEDTQKYEGDKHSRCSQDNDNFSSRGSTVKTHDKKDRTHNPALELKGVRSRELRAGVLYTGCGCVHRDGLQDSCPRTECQGQASCLIKPWPECPIGMMCRTKHPECFGTPPNPDALTI